MNENATKSKFANRHLQNRVIQNGDQIALLVEDNGPDGMYTELGRSCVGGAKVSQAMQDELEFCMQARRMTLDLLKPARRARTSGTASTPSCARTAGRWRRGFTATARATTWSSGR
jgi:hypothetical protein